MYKTMNCLYFHERFCTLIPTKDPLRLKSKIWTGATLSGYQELFSELRFQDDHFQMHSAIIFSQHQLSKIGKILHWPLRYYLSIDSVPL